MVFQLCGKFAFSLSISRHVTHIILCRGSLRDEFCVCEQSRSHKKLRRLLYWMLNERWMISLKAESRKPFPTLIANWVCYVRATEKRRTNGCYCSILPLNKYQSPSIQYRFSLIDRLLRCMRVCACACMSACVRVRTQWDFQYTRKENTK